MSDDYERVKTWCNDPRKMPCAPYNSICRVFEDYDRLRAELSGKEKALSAAKTVIEAKDKAYALIDQRFAAMSAKAATTDSERECNERLTAEIDALTAELAEARRLLDEARKQEPVGFVDSLVGSVFVTGDECDLYKTELMTPVYAAPVPAQHAAVPAEVARAVQILRQHNQWRRGADNNHWQATPYSPAELGRAIDTVCDHVTHTAQPDVLKRATEYAHDIVTWLHRDHYSDNKNFEPFGDLLGLLSQIDNMICGWKEPHPSVPDDVAKDAAEVVAYRIHYPGGAKRLTEDGDVYEHEKRAGLKIDWLGVVGGIDAAVLSAAETEGRKDV